MKKITTITRIGSLKRKPAIKTKRVSNVSSHDYNPETGHLTVTFQGGRRYRYEGVDQKSADGLKNAESKGGYLHRHIIGKFDATKL